MNDDIYDIQDGESIRKFYKKRVNELEAEDKYIGTLLREIKEDNVNIDNANYGYRSELRLYKSMRSIELKEKVLYLKMWNSGELPVGETTFFECYTENEEKLITLRREHMETLQASIIHDMAIELFKKLYK